MVRRRTAQSKGISSRRSSMVKPTNIDNSSSSSLVRAMPTEYLDDETKLAKRHLTKEMWQLVSIAVKRMADELVSMSNSQQTNIRSTVANPEPTMPILSTIQPTTSVESTPTPAVPSMTMTMGAGDVAGTKDQLVNVNEPVKKRASPIHILEPNLQMKKKGNSNNATRRMIKSKVQTRASKKSEKIVAPRLRSNQQHKVK